MAPFVRSFALSAALGGAALAGMLGAAPVKALSLIDNTNSGTANPGPSANQITHSKSAAVTFQTPANFPQSGSPFVLTANITAAAPTESYLNTLTVNLFNANPSGLPVGSAFFSQTYSDPFGLNATDGGNLTLTFQPTVPLAVSTKYALALSGVSSEAIAGGGTSWTWNRSFTPFASGTPLTYVSTSRLTGGTWSNVAGAPAYFYLQDVPGPLPLLGASGAFAWSRCLRRRIKQSVQA